MRRVLLVVAVAAVSLLGAASPAAATNLPQGFQESTVITGIGDPTAVSFAPDGRVFVAEKSGIIKVFDSISDTTPSVFADLHVNVYDGWDRGLLGLALDPDFPNRPYVYVLYTYDAAIGGTAPRWGTDPWMFEGCPDPPGFDDDGCVVSGRLSRLTASGDAMVGPEHVLINDWCQQFASHSVGDLAFGPDGALYVSGGDGASWGYVDYGQAGQPPNPCGDPPTGLGGTQTPPTAEGGALRSQDLRTPGDPVGLNGTILRVDPDTGDALPDNPLADSPDPNARRIIAYGLRNPYRIATRPGTDELYVGDVGWGEWEEIDWIPDPADSRVENFGWPCYEGWGIQPGYDSANLDICEALYGEVWTRENPYYSYRHDSLLAGESCPVGSSVVSGVRFYPGGSYPAAYDGALFFADYARGCIWAMPVGADGLPDVDHIIPFASSAATPVDLEIGPGGDLYYVDFWTGSLRRISYFSANRPPVAVADATPTSGDAPLTVQFDATRSTDPDPGDTLSYAWDLDADGAYDDSTAARPSRTYAAGNHVVSLRVTDSASASSTASVTISAGNTPPTATILKPTAGSLWKVGQGIAFAGSTTDAQDGPLPASAYAWSLAMEHCPSNCHDHALQNFAGVTGGSFTAPDHEYPSYLRLTLTVTDSGGLTATKQVRLNPRAATLKLASNPVGLRLALNGEVATAPFTRTVIRDSTNSVSAPTPQALNGLRYGFYRWSDGGAQTHNVVASRASRTLTARYRR